MKKVTILAAFIITAILLTGCFKPTGPNMKTIEGSSVDYKIEYDANKWLVEEGEASEESEYLFTHVDGDVYAMIIPERIPMNLDSLQEIALENAKSAAEDARIVSEEKKNFGGNEILEMRMQGTIMGIEFEYYGYYYTGDAGTIQFITYTSQDLIDDYEEDLTELLDGLKLPAAGEADEDEDMEDEDMMDEEDEDVMEDADMDTVFGDQVDYAIDYDSNKWVSMGGEDSEDAEYYFEHLDGDVYAMVIPERIEIPYDTLKEIALENALSAAPDAEIVYDEMIDVNGDEMLVMQIEGNIQGIDFMYYGYYYSGTEGTIQFITYTGKSLFDLYKDEMKELLEGFMVL